jgi:NAD(P)-dependent dehydrogenase (short-subunit alcohol dehydrogenase family)
MQTSVVVGGASGIGAAVAARLREAGAEVVVWDVAGGDVVCDITDPDQVTAAVERTVAAVGVPTTVTITAGVGHGGMLLDADPADWDRVMGTNAKGAWLAMRALARPMLDAGGGSIVATSSVSAHLVDRTMGLYGASKAALDMVIRVAAAEWAPLVRVNGVAPGVTDTPMLGPVPRDRGWLADVAGRTALGRLGTPDDVAEVVLAVHDLTWVTGQIVPCDGGLSLRSPINPLGDRR